MNERRLQRLRSASGMMTAWGGGPQWPLSAELGTPMMFLGQFRIPGEGVRMAYLFMTGGEDFVDGTGESERGENALIVQPGRVPRFVTVADEAEGPTMSEDLAVELVPASPAELGGGWDNRLGGPPTWLQDEECPPGGWEFLFQLNGGDEFYGVNFGDAGVGYGFLSADGGEGRFLWQCA